MLDRWANYYDDIGLLEERKSAYLAYAKSLIDRKLPVIFDFIHLTRLLGRTPDYLASAINSPNNHYRSFEIKKKSGGKRKIISPYPALSETQTWILENILNKIPIHNFAHGFVNKRSIITNSKLHKGQKELLKMDLEDFFPSININRIIYIYKKQGYPNIISFYLASLCCYENHLPQGAPTSPYLSNLVAIQLDKRLALLSKKFNLRYTRYADDLTFSGDKIPTKFIEYVSSIIHNEGFVINENKTRLYKSGGKRIVTGVSVATEELKLPREYKRKLRTELHYIFTYGLRSHIVKKKIRKPNYLLSIIGKVNFWLSIEPDNHYASYAINELRKIQNEIIGTNINDIEAANNS
ncbi:retron St85 family RNA-directed DNA polymerase [Parapedobacter sp. 2B3]|uniref:retron St85 family RNA-directed DNA polymerase n=1 Tax=Parapedobacter sp. 2B3 TaxID=3342381 RepID=UPI0035B58561